MDSVRIVYQVPTLRRVFHPKVNVLYLKMSKNKPVVKVTIL